MARGFNLTAEINLRGPTNIRPIINNIRRQLGSINANVNLNIGRTTTAAIGQLNTNLTRLNATLAQTTQSATSATQAFNNLAAAMRSVGTVNIPTTIQAPATRITAAANSARSAIAETRTEFEDFGRQAGLAVRRFAAFSAVTSVIYGFSNALSAGVKQYIEFDKQVTRLSQVTNESKAGLNGLVSEITRLSTGLGVASEDLAKVSVTLAQAGFNAADTRKALEALARSALAPSFDDLNQTVEGSIALMRQFGINANQLESALGSVNAVAAGFAVEASDIISAIQRTGGVFASASKGVSQGTDALNEFIAIFTSVRATTRESAETIATGLRTIFTRIQRADTVEALKDFGVTLTDLEGKFVGPYEAVRRLSEGLGRLDPRDLKFSQIVEELGGFRQIGKVLPLIQQFATAEDALKVAQKGQGSLALDAAKGQQALAVQIQKVREEFTALVRSIGQTEGFQTMVKLGLDLASALIKVADATKGILPLIGIMAAFRGVSAITQFAGGFGSGLRGGQNRRANQGGRIYGFASGGLVPGYGSGDTVPAMLTPGEFVVRKSAVKNIGANKLSKLNFGGEAQASLQTLNSRSDNGAAIRRFQKSSNNFMENDDNIRGFIKKQTFEDYGFTYADYPKLSKELEKQGVKFPIGSKKGSSRGKFDARSGSIMETFLREKMGRGAKKYEGVEGYSDISNAPIDIIKGKSIYEVKFKSGQTSDNEILAKLLRYKLESTNNYDLVGFKENQKQRKDKIDLGTINLVHGADLEDVEGYKSDYIRWLKEQGQYKLNSGGILRRFMAGGTATAKKTKEVFGTGETTFPSRIRKKYAEEKQKEDNYLKNKLDWEPYPNNERITVDDAKVQEAFQQPFDRTKFIESFKQKISRNALFSQMADFAKFIGLPQEELVRTLPLQLDFGGTEFSRYSSAYLHGEHTAARGSRPYEGYDLSRFGYGEPQKQEAYGLEKLIEAKQKEITKIRKTPVGDIFPDKTFRIDDAAYSKANEELRALNNKKYQLQEIKRKAQKSILDEQQKIALETGRRTISFAPSLGRTPDNKNSVMYHELTHQLFKGLKAKQSDSFDKYRKRVVSLFSGENDDLVDAFDALATGPQGGYTSADVVYGRRYKMNELVSMGMSANSRNASAVELGQPQAVQRETITDLMRLSGDAEKATKAREFKPLNPIINKTLLETQNTGRVFDQSYIDALEDSGKEEFLTTLVEKSPQLDSNLQKVLDDTLTDLLSSAGIQRQKYATGGAVQKFVSGGKSGKTTTKQNSEIFDTSPTPMLRAIIARTEGKKSGAREVQLRDYAEEITDVLNIAYDDNQVRDGIVSMMDQHSDVQRYIDVSIKALKADLAYINKGKKLSSDPEIKPLKKRKGINPGDMLDTIMAYQSIGLDYVMNTALAEGRTDQTLEEFMGDSVPEPYKGTARGKIKISQLVKNMEAAAQYEMPSVLYSGLGDSKLDIILKQAKITQKNTIDDLVGKTFSMPSFLSASSAEALADSFARVGSLTISTNPKRKGVVPQNAKTLTLDDTPLSDRSHRLIGQGDKGFAGLSVDRGYAMAYDQEGEYIFPPNSKFRITDVEKFDSRLFPGEGDDNYRHVKMKVQQLKEGGVAQRKVGYIDYDVIANEANKDIVEKGMGSTGIKGPRLYTDYLTQLAVLARKNSDLQKLRAVYGVAGSGKTTLARGQGTDNAALRQTERFPILSPDDIQKATEVIVLSSSVGKDKLDDIFSATDRTYTLSSTTKAEKERVKSQRGVRDATGVGLEGRKPGSTSGVATDTAVGEALLSDRLGDRSVVLGRSDSGKVRRKRDNELVDVIKKKIGFTWGGFAPMTAGHESIMDAAAAMGISPEDFIYLVGSNEGVKPGDTSSYRTAVFDQDIRMILARAGAGAKGAKVLPKPRDFEVPQAFDITEEGSDRRKVLLPKKGSRTFVADKTPEQTKKYKDAGYEVSSIERTGGISGTMVRDLIMSGDMGKLQEVLSPGVYEIISNNIARLQNRANVLPDIIEQVKANQGVKLADVEKEIKALGVTRIDNKKAASDPEYAAKIEVLQELRDKRDKIKSAASFEPYRLLEDLARAQPEKYGIDTSTTTSVAKPMRTMKKAQMANLGGMIQNFADGGEATKPKISLSSRSVADTAKINGISIQDAILQHLSDMKGIAGVRQIASIPGGDRRISQILRSDSIKRGLFIDEAAAYIDRAISAKESSQKAKERDLQKRTKAGLLFGAAGVLGTPFSPVKKTIGQGTLKSPTDVYITSGTLEPSIALKLESLLNNNIDKTTRKAAKKVMIDNILGEAGLGKVLQLDFDRTLAFGADKIGTDTDSFAAFSDPAKIKEGLSKAKLSLLGRELVQLVSKRPELIDNMRVVTARPPKYLDMIQSWLASQGLPIPLSQFTGVGGTSVSGSQIAKLKAAALASDSIFVDDDKKNIREARRANKNISTYRYGLKTVKDDTNREGTTKGNMFERIIEALGGPKANKSMKGIDFPTGLKSAAKYFGIRGDIPTDAKRTLNGPSTVESNIVSYLKAKGYKSGGAVDFEAGVDGSPFDIKTSKIDYYSLEKSSGFKDKEFDELVQYAKINDFSLDEFRSYINKRALQKREKSGSVMDPKSLQSFLIHGAVGPRLGTDDLTEQQKKLAETLKGPTDAKYNPKYDNALKRNSGGSVLAFASGGYVPALLTPGEAVIGPQLAKKIGYGKLNRMNKADKYASGGSVSIVPGSGNSDTFGPVPLEVGSFVIRKKATQALGFNKGGAVGVQRFFFGGRSRGPAARPETISMETIGASNEAVRGLQQIAEALNNLGVASSRSAQLLNRGYQATAAEARRAYEADLIMAQAAGASADVLYDLQQALARTTSRAEAELRLRQTLAASTGNSLQDALSSAEEELTRLTEAARNTAIASGLSGDELEEELRGGAAGRRSQAFENAAAGGALTGTPLDLASLNATGADLERVINSLMRDTDTLRQMNARYIENRREQIAREAQTAGDLARAARIRAGSEQDIEEALQREVRARSAAVEQSAASRGERGPNEQQRRDRQQSLALSFGVITVGNIIADTISAKSSAMEAGIAGGIRGGSQAFSYTNAAIDELNNFAVHLRDTGSRFANLASRVVRLGRGLQLVAVAGQAAIDAYNGVRQFAIELSKSKIEQALNGLSDRFEKLNQDLTQVNLRQTIQTNLIDASKAAGDLRNKSLDTATAGWVNGLDVLVSSAMDMLDGGGENRRRSATRSQVLEKEGTLEYLRTLFGGSGAYEAKAGKMVGTQAQESSQSFQPIAEGINQLIQARIKSGENVGDILGGAEFEDFAKSLVYADVALNKQIRQIELTTSLTEEQKRERIQEIISIHGANKIRTSAAVAQRAKDQKNLGSIVSVYTRSLKRMFTNMEQSINAVSFSLKQMSENIDLATAAFQGQAKIGNVDLATTNVIENPRAYSAGRVSSAQASAGSLFGIRQPEMKQLMNLGETVENTVMSTINDTLKNKGPDSSNELIAREVDKSIRAELKGLGLPPELADKLAKEVGNTLVDLRKSGDDKIDFTQLSEKLAGLNSVIDTAKDAQSVAIKALQHYQNVLNQYTNNLNKITELEVSARERSRKSIDITADSQMELSKSLNRTIAVSDVFAKRNASVGRQTGGAVDPTDIFNNFLKLNRTREIQQSTVNQAAEKGPAGVQDFIKFNNELKYTNIALRENRAALEEMANNTEKASAAMNAIQEAQQKVAGRISFLEKVVTSTPDELESLNQSLYRLQRNMNGQQNSIQNSIGAQKAYQEAINNGASAMEAMRAAQTAFANERKDTLSTLQDVLPFLGDNQQANNTKANVLESMLQESGMGVSPMFQQILNSLRNPDQDPATAAAIKYYNEAIAEQATANRLLGLLDQNLADDIANKNSKAIVAGLTDTILTFQNRELSDIGKNINTIVSIMQRPQPAAGGAPAAPPVVGISTGGMVYAAEGQFVNFQPRGTDTVPAMLTPGEFVVNRRATQANLPLLKSINSGYATGGKVSYYAAGGLITNWGKPDNIKQGGMYTSKPIIDPTEGSELVWRQGAGNIYDLPNSYTLAFNSSNTLPNESFDLNSNNTIDKSQGQVRVGATPTIVKVGKDQYDYKNDNALAAINTIRAGLVKRKDDTSLYFGSGSFSSKNVAQNQETEYQDKIRSVLSGIGPGLKPMVSFNKADYRAKPPTTADFPNPSPNEWRSTLVDKSYGLSFEHNDIGTEFDQIQNSPAFKVWYFKRSPINPAGWAPGLAMAVSVKQPSPAAGSPYAGWGTGNDWVPYKSQTPAAMGPPKISNQQHILQGFKIDDANQLNRENYDLYKNTIDFLNGTLGYTDDGSGQAFMDKFASLYNGTKQYVTLSGTELSPLDELISKDASSATIAQTSLEQQFKTAKENAIANIDKARRDKVKFGLSVPFGGDLDLGKPFTITDEATRVSKSFPFMINGSIDEYLGADFKKIAQEEALKTKGVVSSSLVSDNIKVTIPVDVNGKKPELDIPISYEKYNGQFFDQTSKKFDAQRPIKDMLLANNINGTLFQALDKSSRRLFTATEYGPADILNASNLGDPAVLRDFADLFKMKTNKDPNADAQAKKVAAQLKLNFGPGTSYNKYLGSISDGTDVFSAISNEPFSVNIGDFVLEKLSQVQQQFAAASGKVDQTKMTKGATLTDAELPDATAALIRGSMALFGGLRIPGASNDWLYKAGAPQAIRLALAGNPRGAAQHMSGLLNQAAGYVSTLQNRSTNIQAYNALDNIMTMIGGAANAFGAIAGGDTGLLKQFYEAKSPISGIFRSFGAAARAGKVASLQLSPDWKNLLGNQLQGTSIKVVGRDGTLTDTNLVGAIPENSTVNDLVKVLFNPYNEFPDTKTRSSLIQKFGDDLFNLRGSNGLPYFDPQTLSFIREGLYRLMDWYGGKGKWVGQDYFFDTKAQPDNALRMTTFQDSLNKDGQAYYDAAMPPHMFFGFANAFGALPGAEWFAARGAVVDPVKKASGGMIYAAGGGDIVNFQPQGTDTVPAMLTPGEFVVKRSAVQKNLPLLKAINSGASPYSDGGVVYLAGGGELEKQRNNINAKIEAKIREMNERQQAIDEQKNSWFGRTRNFIIGGATPDQNAQNLDRMTLNQLQRVKAAIDDAIAGRPTAGMDDESRQLLIEQYGSLVNKQASRQLAANRGVQQEYDAEYQAIDATKQTVETSLAVVGAGAGLASSTSVFGNLGVRGTALVSGSMSAAEAGAITAAEGGSAGEVLRNSVIAGTIGAAIPVVGAGLGAAGKKARDMIRRSDLDETGAKVAATASKGADDLPDTTKTAKSRVDAADNTDIIKLPKAQRLLVEKRLSAFKAMVQENQANRIATYIDNIEQEVAFRIKNIDDMITNNKAIQKAYKDAIDQGVTDQDVLSNILWKPYRDDLNKLSDDLRTQGWDVDLGPPLSATRNDDMIKSIIDQDIAADDVWQKTRIKALQDGQQGLSKEGVSALQRSVDDPNIKFENRSWGDWIRGKRDSILKGKKKYIAGTKLGLGYATVRTIAQKAEPANNAKPDLVSPDDGAVVVPPPKPGNLQKEEPAAAPLPAVQPQQQAAAGVPMPDYYDELTYKEYASRAIVAGKAPPAPIKDKFTTAAFYTKEGRSTAYDQRSSKIDRVAGLTAKDAVGGRDVASQTHATTAAFTLSGTPRDNTTLQPQVPVDAEPMNGETPEQAEQRAQLQAQMNQGFVPTGKFGEKTNNRATYKQATANAKLTGAKGISSQYKSAYMWWRYRLGEYNYYSTKNDKLRKRWMEGFGQYDRLTRANQPQADQVMGDMPDTVYAATGTMIPYQPKGTDTVPAMLTPGEFVVNRKATQQNLSLLKSINSGSYSTGGKVVYLEDGTEKLSYNDKIKAARAQRLQEYRKQQTDKEIAYKDQIADRSKAYAQAIKERQQANIDRITGRGRDTQRPQQTEPQAGGGVAQMMHISPQTQQRVGQAAQAAFNPENAGNINKQLTIFGTLLTGVNQTLTQFGVVMQQIVGGAGGGVNNGGAPAGGLDGLGQFTAKFDQFITQLSKLNLPPEININGNHKVEVVVNGAQALQELLNGPLSGLIRKEVQAAFGRLNQESEGSIPNPTKK